MADQNCNINSYGYQQNLQLCQPKGVDDNSNKFDGGNYGS